MEKKSVRGVGLGVGVRGRLSSEYQKPPKTQNRCRWRRTTSSRSEYLIAMTVSLKSMALPSRPEENSTSATNEFPGNFSKRNTICHARFSPKRGFVSAEGDDGGSGEFVAAAQCSSTSSRMVFPQPPVESVASWLTAFAINAVVGDLGDFIVEGSGVGRATLKLPTTLRSAHFTLAVWMTPLLLWRMS